MCVLAISWNDDCWLRVATADVQEADGQFHECAIYAHRSGGGHCIYFGEEEYEGMGIDQACGTYSFVDGVLKDSDGDIINTTNVVRDNCGNSSSESETGDEEEYVPLRNGQRGRGRGGQGRGRRGRGRGGRGRRGEEAPV